MNDTHPLPEAAETSRRSFFSGLFWKCVALLGLMEFGWLLSSLFRSRSNGPAQEKRTKAIIDAGAVDQFIPGQVKAFPQGKFHLVCLEDGSFLALSRTCTHLGCSVPWNDEEQKFICPCHGSTFNREGVVLTAPATRPLDYFPVKIENGLIRVDISRPHRREQFDPAQTMKA